MTKEDIGDMITLSAAGIAIIVFVFAMIGLVVTVLNSTPH